MTTISDGTTTYTPTVVSGYQADQKSRNVLHTVFGVAAQAVTLRASSMRSGQLTAVMPTFASAVLLQTLLTTAAKFIIADSGFSLVGMNFVIPPDGSVSLQPSESYVAWLVAFDYQEVP